MTMLVGVAAPVDPGSDNPNHQRLSVTCASRGRTTLRGDLDICGSATLARASSQIVSNGRGAITVYLDGVTFIDAAGITALIDLARLARAHDRELVLAQPSASVQRLLAIVAGLEVLPFTIATPQRGRRMSVTRRRH